MESLANTDRPIAILLDSVNDPGNLGTIIRLSDNFNAAGIFLAGNSVYEYSGKVIRATMGSFKNIHAARLNNEDYPELEKFFSKEGNFIVTTELTADTSAYDLEPILKRRGAKKILLIAGSESHGIISEDIKKLINNCKNVIRVKIPCHGKNESLNLSVATGILCYEISRYVNAS